VDQGEYAWHKKQSGDGGTKQSADDRAAQRRVLFPAVAHAEGHGHHADDHRQRCHDDGAEARGACLNGRADCIAVLVELAPGERDNKDAVGRGDAHAHNGAHQSGH